MYSWYNPDATSNGGDAGTQDGGSCLGSACDTDGFVVVVNNQGLCGAADWQLPSRFELESITSLDRYYPYPAIDTAWFPKTSSVWSWSSSPYAQYGADAAW